LPISSAAPASPIAVFVHVHYRDIWQEIGTIIAERFDVPFRLVLTSAAAEEALSVPPTRHLVSVETIEVENRGRDIRPFLQAVAQVPDFDIGLKLHTKKSPQREDGGRWRADLLDALMPAGGVGPIVERLRHDPRIGMVAPGGFCLSVDPWIDVNEPGMVKVMARLGHELIDSDLDETFFAAGSMFWFRRASVAALADDRVLDLFEPETGQLDGTIAHAIERLFPVEARRQGFLSCAVPALLASRASDSAADLRDLIRRHADIPNRYFPGPGRPALPPGAADPAPPEDAAAITAPGPMARLRAWLGRARRPQGVRTRANSRTGG
jgi:lipopolysaccharide biosynthesis protein